MKIGFIGLGVMAPKTARALGVAPPNAATAQQLLNACAAKETGGERDRSPLVRAPELASGHHLTAEAK
jgi:2-hydroxy-3-oxopropionate reductase